ncbi:ScyD/ScyE family protein [Actinoplanes sp. G11-F43]|uniref:ScyD/ScyE family protein n=1 Tax=Actinoplanes sp. G11-F43 TaxID=3424130 RepID=UPI003D33D17D
MLGLLSAALVTVSATAMGPEPTLPVYDPRASTIVARGLDNPRGLAFGARGELYVAEAGRGGDGECRRGADGGRICAGRSGAITVVDFGHQWRVVSQLRSEASPAGTDASGPADVAVDDDGELIYTDGAGLHRGPARLSGVGSGFAVLPGGRGYLVVDPAGNALRAVTARGRVRTVATFPVREVAFPAGIPDGPPPGSRFPMESRPSSVAVGPDGAWYVGERTGFPSPVGAARIWRVVPGRAPEVWATGFTRIADLAWSTRGDLFVLEAGQAGRSASSAKNVLSRKAGRAGLARQAGELVGVSWGERSVS